ncbi:MAG: dUTP diphosphatase [Candidatus Pacearchaeota archaeon]
MTKIPVKIKILHPSAKIPIYGTEHSAGFDIYAIEDIILEPGKQKIVNTGIALEIPEGYCVQFWDRGGMGAKGIHHFAGLIDSDYRGEFKVVLFNSTKEPYKIEKGDRIIQAVILPIVQADFQVSDTLSETKRGDGRFHSTGKK